MCQRCVRRSRNLGRPRTVRHGLVKHLAHHVTRTKFADIPLFAERAANYAVEAHVYRIQQARTNRKFYHRNRSSSEE